MLRPAAALCALALLAAPAALAHGAKTHDHAETRELGAHVHGHASLAVAVEGAEVAMELRAPGADVVGFEHAPETDEDRTRVKEALATLEAPLALFVPPAEAGCAVASATATLVALGADGAEEIDLDHAPDHGHDHGEEGHTEFRAEYRLTCADPARLDRLTFAWFELFPASEAVAVDLVSDRGARSFEATREAPALDLGGAI